MKPGVGCTPAVVVAVLVVAVLLAACGGASSTPDAGLDGGTENGPRYAFVTVLPSFTGGITYVNLVDSLDLTELDPTAGRTFPDIANAWSQGDKLFVSDGESPQITRFSIEADASWVEEETISFAGLGSFGGVTATFLDARTAVSPVEVLGSVEWDPETMTITETRDAPEQVPLRREGLLPNLSFETAVRDGRLYQPVYWADPSYVTYTETSQIMVYDAATAEVIDVLDVPCPHLHIVSRDADDNLYFSNGSGSGTMGLFDERAPRNCVVRINRGENRLDETFRLFFTDLAGGRDGAAFRVVDDRTAMFAVFHDEDVEIGPGVNPQLINISPNWRLWRYDLETGEATPVEGLDPFAGQYLLFRLEGRLLLSYPEASFQSTTVYELIDGALERRFSQLGWLLYIRPLTAG